MNLLDDPAFRTYALTSSILGVHMVTLALWTSTVRVLRKQWVNPEDAKLSKGEKVDVEHPDVARVKRAHANAIENAIPFFVVAGLYISSNPPASGVAVYLWTFVAARLLHTVFYLWGRQPFRTLSFAVGVLAILGMALHVIRHAI